MKGLEREMTAFPEDLRVVPIYKEASRSSELESHKSSSCPKELLWVDSLIRAFKCFKPPSSPLPKGGGGEMVNRTRECGPI